MSGPPNGKGHVHSAASFLLTLPARVASPFDEIKGVVLACGMDAQALPKHAQSP